MLYVMFYVIMMSRPVAQCTKQHGRPTGDVALYARWHQMTFSAKFMELNVWGKSSETVWNFITGMMERKNCRFGQEEVEITGLNGPMSWSEWNPSVTIVLSLCDKLIQANSAFHPSGVGKWGPASAEKEEAGKIKVKVNVDLYSALSCHTSN